MSRGTIARINSAAANHNLKVIQKKYPDAKIWAVVKANAYGHGAIKLTAKLTHCDGFAVATLDEALELRQADIKKPILLLEGCLNVLQTKSALDNGLTLTLHCIEQIEDLEKLAETEQYALQTLWLKVDTGMHRLGLALNDLKDSFERLAKIKWINNIGVMTHFSSADELDNDFTQLQITRLKQYLPKNCSLISMANSAAIFNPVESTNDWVRPGIAMYGASPFVGVTAKELNLLPVMQLSAPIIAIRDVEIGEGTGYGKIWTAKRKTKIATVAIGYGDGYPRACKQGAPVFVNGKRVELIGRVSMDLITIDVSDVAVSLYDQVELWGNEISVDEVASYCDSIGYELLTRVSARVMYQYD
ncbi:MAG: alanine racemase [Saccharospirillaceae bacterium]|nr:alanine racemase [Pseudomonadales bacterium]NRB80042.1 alanine racemase [Saccharospirillaceae bacterium]